MDVELLPVNQQPVVRILSKGDEHDPSTGITRGSGKYLVFFPNLQRSVGLEVTIVAGPHMATRYECRCTSLEVNPESIYRQLFGGK